MLMFKSKLGVWPWQCTSNSMLFVTLSRQHCNRHCDFVYVDKFSFINRWTSSNWFKCIFQENPLKKNLRTQFYDALHRTKRKVIRKLSANIIESLLMEIEQIRWRCVKIDYCIVSIKKIIVELTPSMHLRFYTQNLKWCCHHRMQYTTWKWAMCKLIAIDLRECYLS